MARVRTSCAACSMRSRVLGLVVALCRSTTAELMRKWPGLMSHGGCGGTHDRACAATAAGTTKNTPTAARSVRISERATGFEPVTSSLGSWHSTPELRPRSGRNVFPHPALCQSLFLAIAPRRDADAIRLELERMALRWLERGHLYGIGGDHLARQVHKLEYQLQRRARGRSRVRHGPFYISSEVRRVELADCYLRDQCRVANAKVMQRRIDLAVLLLRERHDANRRPVHRIDRQQSPGHRQRRHRVAHPQRRIGTMDQRFTIVRI